MLRTSPAGMLHRSNAVTYASLYVGLVSIASVVWWHNVALSSAGIALSVVLDTFDGRFAGLFDRTAEERAFGVQLDSLADAGNSGVVPVVVVTTMLWPTTLAAIAWLITELSGINGGVAALGRFGFNHIDGQGFTERRRRLRMAR